MDQICRIASDLNEKSENKYALVYEIAELAKRLVDEVQTRKTQGDFGYEYEAGFGNSKKEKPVQHAIMVKASESDDSGLVG